MPGVRDSARGGIGVGGAQGGQHDDVQRLHALLAGVSTARNNEVKLLIFGRFYAQLHAQLF